MALIGFQARSGRMEIGFAAIAAITTGGIGASATATLASGHVTLTSARVMIGTAGAAILIRGIGRCATGAIANSPERGMSNPRRLARDVQHA